MGLFDKKYCDICGEKIGLLGNRKLEDGNLCKKCAGKLSPFFSERRKSTVDQIRDQLAYREANRARVEAFRVTAVYGDGTKIYLDETAESFMVSGASDLKEANPDVIDLSAVTSCRLEVQEVKHEEKTKDKEGKTVSCNPPRYTYNYNFILTIYVDHPYFDEIHVRLNGSHTVDTGRHPVTGQNAFRGELSAYQAPDRVMPYAQEYVSYVLMAKEAESGLMRRKRARAEEPAAPAHMEPRGPMECPRCGAMTTPDAGGCCEYCGSRIV